MQKYGTFLMSYPKINGSYLLQALQRGCPSGLFSEVNQYFLLCFQFKFQSS